MGTNSKLTTEIIKELFLRRSANIFMLLVWIAAGIGIMLPFALGTSPLDAILLTVPHNEGNWWHALVGLPFFLSIPMIWLHLNLLISQKMAGIIGRRILWAFITFSAFGTLLVETPFLLHRAGTSELQRLEVIFLGIGMILVNGIFLYFKRKIINPTRALLIGIVSAYLANAFLCLIVYGEAKFEDHSRSGWYLTLIVVFPIFIELMWLIYKRPNEK